jgi:hypothetical protein
VDTHLWPQQDASKQQKAGLDPDFSPVTWNEMVAKFYGISPFWARRPTVTGNAMQVQA